MVTESRVTPALHHFRPGWKWVVLMAVLNAVGPPVLWIGPAVAVSVSHAVPDVPSGEAVRFDLGALLIELLLITLSTATLLLWARPWEVRLMLRDLRVVPGIGWLRRELIFPRRVFVALLAVVAFHFGTGWALSSRHGVGLHPFLFATVVLPLCLGLAVIFSLCVAEALSALVPSGALVWVWLHAVGVLAVPFLLHLHLLLLIAVGVALFGLVGQGITRKEVAALLRRIYRFEPR